MGCGRICPDPGSSAQWLWESSYLVAVRPEGRGVVSRPESLVDHGVGRDGCRAPEVVRAGKLVPPSFAVVPRPRSARTDLLLNRNDVPERCEGGDVTCCEDEGLV